MRLPGGRRQSRRTDAHRAHAQYATQATQGATRAKKNIELPTVRTHHMGASAAAPSADARHLAYASGIQGKAGASIDPHLSRVGAPGGRRPGSRKDRGRQELLFSTQI
jgi:hypothetical protein